MDQHFLCGVTSGKARHEKDHPRNGYSRLLTHVARVCSGVRVALPEDEATLVELMADFYAEAGFELNRRHAAMAFAALLRDARLGQVWLIEADSQPAGYLVLTFGYSMEYGGPAGILEDLFVRAEFRGRGLGTAAARELRAFLSCSRPARCLRGSGPRE